MALIKEPYGLVYNTDGTLCTTYRDDDIPFRGVRSFAVEEATTNLIDFDSKSVHQVTLLEQNPYEYKILSNSIDDFHHLRFSQIKFIISPATVSFYLSKNSTVSSLRFNLYNTVLADNELWAVFDLITETLSITTGYNGKVEDFDRWWRISVTADVTLNNNFFLDLVTSEENKEFILKTAQVEEKAYSTSFVDGSRPTGIIAFPFYIDLNTEDWVVSFWHKMTNTHSFANRIIFSIDGNFHLNTYHPSAGKYNWMCMNTDNVIFRASSTTTVDTNWNFIVLTKNGSNFKVYINGIPEINLNYTGTLKYNVNNFKFGNFGIGGIGELSYVSNSLFSNIYIGKYRRKDGTVIWTDDYIREVYEAQMPFAVQNQLSIY